MKIHYIEFEVIEKVPGKKLTGIYRNVGFDSRILDDIYIFFHIDISLDGLWRL